MSVRGFTLRSDGDFQHTLNGEFVKTPKKQSLSPFLPYSSKAGFLPPLIHYISPDRNVVCFERPSFQTTLNFYGVPLEDLDTNFHELQEFTVFVPRTFYTVIGSGEYINDIYVYALNNYPSSFDEINLGLLPLPNLYENSRFCIPSTFEVYSSVSEMIQIALSLIWDSSFNMDIPTTIEYAYLNAAPAKIINSISDDARPLKLTSEYLQAWSSLNQFQVSTIKWPAANLTVHPHQLVHNLLPDLHRFMYTVNKNLFFHEDKLKTLSEVEVPQQPVPAALNFDEIPF